MPLIPDDEFTIVDRRPPKHELRRTFKGRAELREMGVIDRNSHDSRSKPFIGWDGEGITHGPDGTTAQSYVLLAASTGDYIQNEGQLTTRECFDLMLRVSAENPHAIMVGFAFNYDSEMILSNVTPYDLSHLITGGSRRLDLRGKRDHASQYFQEKPKSGFHPGEYSVEFIPRKWFRVSGDYKGKKVSCKIWDIWSFFGTTFLKSIEKHLKVSSDELEKIQIGKDERGQFTTDQLRSGMMLEYCQLELKYLVRLMNRMRDYLIQVELCPSSWHGPPAIAHKVFQLQGVKKHKAETPGPVNDAAQFAFFGGRIENIRVGRAWQPCYKWDLRSAYPTAMRECPSLAGRRWKFREISRDDNAGGLSALKLQRFAMYYVTLRLPPGLDVAPNPLPYRSKKGEVAFANHTRGWYWGPEVIEAFKMNYLHQSGTLIVHAAWEIDLSDGPLIYPFAQWVQDIYDQRMEFKNAGNPAEHALKIALNSAYGKLCQTAGWERRQRIPPWHQLEWAGYLTSATRATVWRAAFDAYHRGGLISMETDAVLTTVDMSNVLTEGKGMGEWDKEKLDDVIYLQSGIYFYSQDGEWNAKYRGMDRQTISLDATMAYLNSTDMTMGHKEFCENLLCGFTKDRFVGSKSALSANFEQWRCWVPNPVKLNISMQYKRVHLASNCKLCAHEHKTMGADGMHDLMVNPVPGGVSYATQIPWRTVKHQSDLVLARTDDFEC